MTNITQEDADSLTETLEKALTALQRLKCYRELSLSIHPDMILHWQNMADSIANNMETVFRYHEAHYEAE